MEISIRKCLKLIKIVKLCSSVEILIKEAVCKQPSLVMDNVYTTVRPFYCVLKFLGGFPMSFEGPARKGIFKQKLCDVLNPCIAACTFFLIFGMVFSRDDTIYSPSEILMRAWIFSLIFCLLMDFIAFCYQIAKRNSIVKFLKQIDVIDKKVKKYAK